MPRQASSKTSESEENECARVRGDESDGPVQYTMPFFFEEGNNDTEQGDVEKFGCWQTRNLFALSFIPIIYSPTSLVQAKNQPAPIFLRPHRPACAFAIVFRCDKLLLMDCREVDVRTGKDGKGRGRPNPFFFFFLAEFCRFAANRFGRSSQIKSRSGLNLGLLLDCGMDQPCQWMHTFDESSFASND